MHMRAIEFLTFLCAGFVVAISVAASASSVPADQLLGTRSYLSLPINAAGIPRALPFVWERQEQGRHIAIIGTRHVFDPNSPMYPKVEAIFVRVRPQLVLHESSAPAGLSMLDRSEAIKTGADLGFAAHLAKKYGAEFESADALPRQEIAALLQSYSKEEVFVFLTAQRHIGSSKNPDLTSSANEYPRFYKEYLLANGFPPKTEWTSWQAFAASYRRITGRAFSSKNWDKDLFSPISNSGRLSEIARASNGIRDRHLLASVQIALRKYDRVVVVFGNWHVLALEPILEQVMPRKPQPDNPVIDFPSIPGT